jgi:hypothetical protein
MGPREEVRIIDFGVAGDIRQMDIWSQGFDHKLTSLGPTLRLDRHSFRRPSQSNAYHCDLGLARIAVGHPVNLAQSAGPTTMT